MMNRTLLLIFPAALAMTTCDRSPESGFLAFDPFLAASEAEPGTPVEATAAQRQFDARLREPWGRILSRLGGQIDSLDQARRFCAPPSATPAAASPQDLMDPVEFGRLQTLVEAASDQLKTDIAQLDPTGSRSALFLPARRLNRTIGTVLLSTLEISCGTRTVFDSRLRSARRQLQEMRTYLDRL